MTKRTVVVQTLYITDVTDKDSPVPVWARHHPGCKRNTVDPPSINTIANTITSPLLSQYLEHTSSLHVDEFLMKVKHHLCAWLVILPI